MYSCWTLLVYGCVCFPCLLACLLACLLILLLALLACLFACLLVCLFVCLLVSFLVCLLALLAWSPPSHLQKGNANRFQMRKRHANDAANGSQGSHMGASKAQNWSSRSLKKWKIEKFEASKNQKVEKVNKSWANERLQSENIDISFILQQKIITPRKFHNFEWKNNSNSWSGHKNIVSCLGLFEKLWLLHRIFSANVRFP